MPVAGHQHQDGEFVPQARHAALADGTAAVRNHAGQVMDHPGPVAPDGRYGEVLLHLAASVPQGPCARTGRLADPRRGPVPCPTVLTTLGSHACSPAAWWRL